MEYTIEDIETSHRIHTDSNHYPMLISYKRKLAEPEVKQGGKSWKAPQLRMNAAGDKLWEERVKQREWTKNPQ